MPPTPLVDKHRISHPHPLLNEGLIQATTNSIIDLQHSTLDTFTVARSNKPSVLSYESKVDIQFQTALVVYTQPFNNSTVR